MGIKRANPAGADFTVDIGYGAPKLTCKRSRIWSSDDYEETADLGQGTYGGVVEARHRCTGATYAVKKPLRCQHEVDGGVTTCACNSNADTLREAAFLAACHDHRAIVQLKAISHDAVSGKLSLVMEHVGPSLCDVLHVHRRGQHFTEAEVRCIMRQLLGGAKHMHRRRVVHCDIKPENILVGRDGGIKDVKMCDMGLAVSMAEPPPYSRCGTYSYMAPEVLLGKTDYDAMVDMWSLGCVMGELLTGKPLFNADDDAGTLLAIFRVLGFPLYTLWPAHDSLPLAGKLVTRPGVIPGRNRLRQSFPDDVLSEEGFEVLRGLLSCNIDKRLSATAALRRPWFTNAVDAPA
ncbi:unnamed protein product [Alopecurus aequalis]